ncbi:MAG: glycosyltransferase family 4 protein [Verrucomicrobiales bacterium]|nr:glycosyltransferase family 4 protein [Verrucomicrobiales bacterium]
MVPNPLPAPVDPAAPRVLLLHGETIFCAGAQRMLAYFLQGTQEAGIHATLALAPSPKLEALLPPNLPTLPLPSNQRFSLPGLLRQTLAVRRLVRQHGFQILHGWTARDWELTAAAALATRCPSIGLLHDHPVAPHISPSRRRLMRLCGTHVLSRVLCVSHAVAQACRDQRYPAHRVCVVHNGIPMPPTPEPSRRGPVVRLGYLGVFSERKGLRVLFQIIDELAQHLPAGWELHLAGGTQEEAGTRLMEELKARYADRAWWSQLHWRGWITNAPAFIAEVDLLIMPSSEFDPFPTVLLEAGAAARPVLAARVGGVPEIVEDGLTGWCFDPTQPAAAARRLAQLVQQPELLHDAGAAAGVRARAQFSVSTMAAAYARLYRELAPRQGS